MIVSGNNEMTVCYAINNLTVYIYLFKHNRNLLNRFLEYTTRRKINYVSMSNNGRNNYDFNMETCEHDTFNYFIPN